MEQKNAGTVGQRDAWDSWDTWDSWRVLADTGQEIYEQRSATPTLPPQKIRTTLLSGVKLARSLSAAASVHDAAGSVTRINPAAERLFGAPAVTVGKPIDLVARDPRIAQAVTDVLRSHAPVAAESAAEVLPWAVVRIPRAT